MSDLRFAFRQLLKFPAFTLVAVATLALGIGANTAIFSVVNAVLLRPLPYPEPDRLMQVGEIRTAGRIGGTDGGAFTDWENQSTAFESLAALHPVDKNLTAEGDPVVVSGAEVSARYLRVLRLNPVLGRDFTDEEDAPGGNRHVVLLSHAFWSSHFHGDPAVVGRAVRLDSESYTVIGVLPPQALPNPATAFLTPATIRVDAYKMMRNQNYGCLVIGRLKPGVTREQAAAELMAGRAAILSEYPAHRRAWSIGIQPLQTFLFGSAQPFALTLLAAVGAVLLIACANVANLLLVKSAARQNEIAVRIALGATRTRLIRQLLTESMLLALAGGAAGVLLASWSLQPLVVLTQLDRFAPGLTVALDVRVALFALLATVGTGLLFGLLPALALAKPQLNSTLKQAARGTRASSRLQSLLVVSETALTVVLLVCAGLLIRSFARAYSADTGFDRDNVITFNITQPASKAPTIEHRTHFIRDALRQLAEIPGVLHAGMASTTPMAGRNNFGDYVSREDRPETRTDFRAAFDGIDGEFFAAVGIPLLRGRLFTPADNESTARRVMIINRTLARQLFGDDDPIGRQLHFKDAAWEIVGIVGDVRQRGLDVAPAPAVYFPVIHFPWYASFVVRTQSSPLTITRDLRNAIAAVDPELPVANLMTLREAADNSLQNRRTMLTLLGLFAGVALALACIGIYGVMACSVAQRTRELGIRMALGASATRMVALVLGDGLKLVVLGLVLGIVGSYAAARLIAAQLYATSETDPAVLAAVALVLLAVAVLACWLPAHRASRVDPIEALRAE